MVMRIRMMIVMVIIIMTMMMMRMMIIMMLREQEVACGIWDIVSRIGVTEAIQCADAIVAEYCSTVLRSNEPHFVVTGMHFAKTLLDVIEFRGEETMRPEIEALHTVMRAAFHASGDVPDEFQAGAIALADERVQPPVQALCHWHHPV